ncbi:MAG: RNase H family protein [Acetivibrio ethanolgignens]
MKQVNIYIDTGIKGPRRQKGACGYVLECQTAKGPATLTQIKQAESMTQHQAELYTLLTALTHIKEPCDLVIYTDSAYLAGTWKQNWPEKWAAAGWKNSRGEEVGNRQEWEEMLNLLNGRSVDFRLNQNHHYREWLAREIERRKEDV